MLGRRLFPVITAGVALLGVVSAWLLFDVWQRSRPVDDEQAAAIARQGELLTEQLQQGLSERVTGELDSAQQERMDSPLGLALFRKCVEWTEFNANHPSDSARSNERQACGEYRHFVETGELPE